jgi:hypothetical protein
VEEAVETAEAAPEEAAEATETAVEDAAEQVEAAAAEAEAETEVATEESVEEVEVEVAEEATVAEEDEVVATAAEDDDPVTVDDAATAAGEVATDLGLGEDTAADAAEGVREAAESLGLSDEDVDAAATELRTVRDQAVEGASEASDDEVAAAMRALEALEEKADQAMAEDSEEISPEEGLELLQEVDAAADDVLADNEQLQDAASRAEAVVAELGGELGDVDLEEINERRREFFERANEERNRKRERITFIRTMTKVKDDPELQALEEFAATAPTLQEQRDFMRQYYNELFAQLRAEAPEISDYIDEKEAEYMGRIDRSEVDTEAIDLEAPYTPEEEEEQTAEDEDSGYMLTF